MILGEIDKLTMNALVHLDEFGLLLEQLGGWDRTWTVDLDREVHVDAVDQHGKYVLMMVNRYSSLEEILDHSQLTDADTLKRLAHLVELGVVKAVD